MGGPGGVQTFFSHYQWLSGEILTYLDLNIAYVALKRPFFHLVTEVFIWSNWSFESYGIFF